MVRLLVRSRGASFKDAWTCAAVMSVAAIGACAFAEDAMSNTKIPITILRMRWLLSFAVVVSKRSVCCRRIAHSGALPLVGHLQGGLPSILQFRWDSSMREKERRTASPRQHPPPA